MKINETQLEQVNDRIQALVRSNSFYGKKLEAAGMVHKVPTEEGALYQCCPTLSRTTAASCCDVKPAAVLRI